jgi:HlyD family secretion protein
MNKIRAFVAWIFGSKIRLVVAGILILATIGFGIIKLRPQTQPRYQTETVQRGQIVSSVTVSGQILNANSLNVTTGASGIISSVLVHDGDLIAPGQKLMEITLDPTGTQKNAQAWAAYLSAKSTLDSAGASQYTLQSDMFTKWKTYTDLAVSGQYQNGDGTAREDARGLPQFKSTQDDWLAAEAKYKNQQGVIAQAQAALANSWLTYTATSPTLTAPTGGTISNITVTPGMMVDGATTPVRFGVIATGTSPLASYNVSEIDVAKIQPGKKATITLDSLSGKTFTGKVATVDRIGTTSNGVTNYPVVIQFDTTAPEILPNMATTAHIILDTKDSVLLVPTSAVQTQNDQSTVRILRNGQVETRTVETGLASDTQIEIISGVSEGDQVITSVATQSTSRTTGNQSVFGGFGGGGFRGGAGGQIRVGR